MFSSILCGGGGRSYFCNCLSVVDPNNLSLQSVQKKISDFDKCRYFSVC